MKRILLISFLLMSKNLLAQNKISYSIKYKYEWQKDVKVKNSIYTDIMLLDITKDSTNYYSYLRQIGKQNSKSDIDSKKSMEYIQQNPARYNADSESEIITFNIKQKSFRFADKLTYGGLEYFYNEKIDLPIWSITGDSMKILNFNCQKATTIYKGRNYIAWFTNEIPISSGPWLFRGLPGLILKISDTENQFNFQCLELKSTSFIDFKNYKSAKLIKKEELKKLKKLKATDMEAYDKMLYPELTITTTSSDGTVIPTPKRKIKPYNPIDISDK